MNYNHYKKGGIYVILLCLMALCCSCTSISEKEQQEDEQILWTQWGKENSTLYVDTTLQYRNILIEELTGIKCYYCPDGHKKADYVANTYKGKAFIINMHVGDMAGGDPDYRTEEGETIYNTLKDCGLPCAYINRYPWGYSNLYPKGREDYSLCSYNINCKPAYINIAAQSAIDKTSRKLTVNIQAYFTDTTGDTSLLNVALLQNNILGPQSGADVYYPEHYNSNTGLYTHNHMLRAMLTDTWGEVIPYNGKGTLYNHTITYTIPEKLGKGNIDVVLEDLEILVYVTQPAFYNKSHCSVNVINVNRSSLVINGGDLHCN